MKRISYLLVLLTVVALFAASCGKDGAVGPAGSKGDNGANGATGAVGPAGPPGANGKAGSVIYSGSTTPAASLGANGDFYLDVTTSLLYGPKTAAGWGSGFSLKGSTGAAGTPGSKTLSGIGVPAASLGANGDFYLDKASYLLYGPKAAGSWGAPVSLKGPAGTANVEYTDWLTPPSYVKDTIFGTFGFYHDLLIPKITQAVLDNGTVIVYGKLDGYNPIIWPTDQVGQLPINITYLSGSNANIDTWSALVSPGKVRIELKSSLNAYGGISNAHQFRVLIIPGGVSIPATVAFKDMPRYFRITDH